jgi:hypothetical protein
METYKRELVRMRTVTKKKMKRVLIQAERTRDTDEREGLLLMYCSMAKSLAKIEEVICGL